MNVNLSEEANQNTFIAWVVTSLLSADQVRAMFPDREKLTSADVKLIINDTEVDMRVAFARLEEEMQYKAKIEGFKLVEARVKDMDQSVDTIAEVLRKMKRNFLREVKDKLGLEWTEDDERGRY